MTEYVLGPDEDQQEVAQRLLTAAKDPASVSWSPRPNTHPHGGVFLLAEEEADAIIAAVAAERKAQDERIAAAVAAADARDAKANETGLTPEQLGFPANATPVEPANPADDESETPEDAADEAVVDDPSTPEDEHADAQDRVAKRRAARKAAAAPADEQKSE